MLACNLNCRLMRFEGQPEADATELRHTTLATARLRFLFIAAKIWRHPGRTGVSYGDHNEEKGVFQRSMDRLRQMVPRGQRRGQGHGGGFGGGGATGNTVLHSGEKGAGGGGEVLVLVEGDLETVSPPEWPVTPCILTKR